MYRHSRRMRRVDETMNRLLTSEELLPMKGQASLGGPFRGENTRYAMPSGGDNTKNLHDGSRLDYVQILLFRGRFLLETDNLTFTSTPTRVEGLHCACICQ